MSLQQVNSAKKFINLSYESGTVKGQKFLWRFKDIDLSKALSLSHDFNLSPSIVQVLLSRGFVTHDDINSFIFTTIEKNVFDANLFKDSQVAVARITKAIEKKEKILIFGDYDVDGITATSLLLAALVPLGANINFYLPNRIYDGYGLSEKIVKKAASNDYSLLITVDNGITAYSAAVCAKNLGLDLIITDHHRPHGQKPHAVAIIDANQHDCSYPFKDLAGVGIIFKIVSLIYKNKGLDLPDKVYELLMLGTIADVAPLISENRYWVKYGLSKINKQRSLSLNILAKNSELKKEFLDSLDIGFMIAPQINALGRLDDPRIAVKFLIGSDEEEIAKIGLTLKQINEERKKIDRQIYFELESAIFDKRINLESENIIVAASQDWPAGVIGLVAGKLTQNYGKPSLLFHIDEKGFLKGSCRSIAEFNIFDALSENSDLLESFGGHSFAAGLKLKQENLQELKYRLENKIAKELSSEELVPKIYIDATVDLAEIKNNFWSDLQLLEPFGNKNEQPLFCIKNVTILNSPILLKERHVKCSVFSDGIIKPVIFFNRPDLYNLLNNIADKSFNLAAYVIKNEWNGKINIELQGVDIAFF